jgi:hypothetical protein
MSGTAQAVLVLLVIVLAVATVVLVVKIRAGDREPGRPDEISEEVAAGLMAELRKWQAEAAHWKATAERLQRELDQRQ